MLTCPASEDPMSSLVARFPRVFVSELWLVSARPEHRVCPSCSWKPSSPSQSPGPAVPRFPASAPSLPPPLSLSHAGLHPSLLAVVHALSSALPSPSTWAHVHTQHIHTYICGRAHKHTHTHAHTQLTNHQAGWLPTDIYFLMVWRLEVQVQDAGRFGSR